ncbi:hypothetical protein [Pararhodobacter aggregans]|uniref:hypothetical protein n=1 Tax=Pararhodobacter aggregans TaxID=404875 RepID=UPI003A9562DA
MTSVLSPVAPPGSFARDALTTLLSAVPRTAAPVAKVESARAVKPVDVAPRPELPRNPAERERPVGPPPSFEINVLQDIRTRLAEPQPRLAPDSDDPAPAEPRGQQAEAPEAPIRPTGTDAEPAHLLDRKV